MFDKFEIVETKDHTFDIVVTYGTNVGFYAVDLRSIQQAIDLMIKEGQSLDNVSIVVGSRRFCLQGA